MVGRFLFISFLLISVVVMAGEGFYSSEKLPSDFNHVGKVLPATFEVLSVTAGSSTSGTCSGVFVSREGHLLTALHCISACLIEQDLLARTKSTTPILEVLQSRRPWPQDVTCPIVFEGYLRKAKVLFTGRGVSFFDDSAITSYKQSHRETFINYSDDYAILKIDSDGPTSCVPTAKQFTADETVWQIGFPRQSKRGHLDSSGRGKFVSAGRIYSSYLHNPEFGRRISTWPAETRIFFDSYFSRKGTILSNVDTLPGSSGSPIVNSLGELLAITAILVVEDPMAQVSKYVEPLVQHVGVSYIREEAQISLGASAADRVFSCSFMY